jgi:hypothetical protein
MDYAGEECVPAQVGLIKAYTHDHTPGLRPPAP